MNNEASFPNPHNPRQRIAPIHTLVDPDNPQRDGEEWVHDGTQTRMANCVRYMRGSEMYMPPNPWPEAMLLYGLNREGSLSCAFVMLLGEFETIPVDTLFGLCAEETIILFYIPFPKMPPSDRAAKYFIRRWLEKTTDEELAKMTLYLQVNGWWVKKDDTGTTGGADNLRTGSGGDHQGADPDERRPGK